MWHCSGSEKYSHAELQERPVQISILTRQGRAGVEGAQPTTSARSDEDTAVVSLAATRPKRAQPTHTHTKLTGQACFAHVRPRGAAATNLGLVQFISRGFSCVWKPTLPKIASRDSTCVGGPPCVRLGTFPCGFSSLSLHNTTCLPLTTAALLATGTEFDCC
ncbi:hypothetical protein BKA81DRAFT_347081 [Phyllosticta paracitricarpa]